MNLTITFESKSIPTCSPDSSTMLSSDCFLINAVTVKAVTAVVIPEFVIAVDTLDFATTFELAPVTLSFAELEPAVKGLSEFALGCWTKV